MSLVILRAAQISGASPHVTVQVLEHFPSHGVVVWVQTDFDHVVHGVLTPVVVFPGFVEVP